MMLKSELHDKAWVPGLFSQTFLFEDFCFGYYRMKFEASYSFLVALPDAACQHREETMNKTSFIPLGGCMVRCPFLSVCSCNQEEEIFKRLKFVILFYWLVYLPTYLSSYLSMYHLSFHVSIYSSIYLLFSSHVSFLPFRIQLGQKAAYHGIAWFHIHPGWLSKQDEEQVVKKFLGFAWQTFAT